MKEKFEAAIRDKCRERLGRNNVVGIIEAAERCNTLHKQAMKEEREKMLKFAEWCSGIDYIYHFKFKHWFCENEERPNKTTTELFDKFNK